MSEWLEILRAECGRTSQGQVAKRLGIARSAINMVLKGTYEGRLDKIEVLVKEHLLPETIACPILGEIKGKTCFEWRGKELASTSSHRVKMWQACRQCPNNPAQGIRGVPVGVSVTVGGRNG